CGGHGDIEREHYCGAYGGFPLEKNMNKSVEGCENYEWIRLVECGKETEMVDFEFVTFCSDAFDDLLVFGGSRI
ncbi:MAG: hypothetical protein ACLFQE_07535, partial [Thermotogota bacterium]